MRPQVVTVAAQSWEGVVQDISGRSRAALALTEALTRLSDREDPVPDEIWEEAARHYDEKALAALTLAIANINVWNRLNVASGKWQASGRAESGGS